MSILVAHHARQKKSPDDKLEEWERRNIDSLRGKGCPYKASCRRTRRQLQNEEDIAEGGKCESSKYPDKRATAEVYSTNLYISGRFAVFQFGSLSKKLM